MKSVSRVDLAPVTERNSPRRKLKQLPCRCLFSGGGPGASRLHTLLVNDSAFLADVLINLFFAGPQEPPSDIRLGHWMCVRCPDKLRVADDN